MVTDETLTVQEVADYLKVSRTTVWRWCHQGLIPAFKIGRGWRVRRGELEQIMEQKKEEVSDHKLILAQGKGDNQDSIEDKLILADVDINPLYQ